jgi:hypothetical protein
MHRLNVALVAGLLALAAILGTEATTRTVSLGATQRHASAATLQARTKRLDAFERSLRRALARKMPRLPRVPHVPPPAPPSVAPLAPAAPTGIAQVRTVYRRPPPIVVAKHTHHGDDGGSEFDGGGGGADD